MSDGLKVFIPITRSPSPACLREEAQRQKCASQRQKPKPGDLGSPGSRGLPCFLQRGHEVFLHVFGSRADNGNCFFQLLIRYPEPPGPITTLPSPIQGHPMRVGRIFREIVSHNASLGQLLLSADAELLTNFHSYFSITSLAYSNLAAHAAIPNLPKFERVIRVLVAASPIKYPRLLANSSRPSPYPHRQQCRLRSPQRNSLPRG